MSLDIGKSFTFLSDDPDWIKKLAIGGGLILAFIVSFITILGWIPIGLILTGYLIQLTRNVIRGEARPLPEWDNWGERMLDGLKAWLVGFIYALPATIISLGTSLPSILNSVRQGVSGTTSSGSTLAATQGISTLGSCLAWIVGIVTSFFVTVALGRYAATSDLGQAFQIGPIFATIRQNFVTYLVIGLINGILIGLITSIGFIAFCIGAAFTGFYGQLVLYHLYGQAHRLAEGLGPQSSYGQPSQQQPF